MKSIVEHLGFGYLTRGVQSNIPHFSALKSRLRDQFMQDWSSYINNSSKLSYYCNFKEEFKFENYLTSIQNDHLRKHLTSIRLSSHPLEIETGRKNGIDRNNRLCKLCSMKVVESEFHFILCCPRYRFLREKYMINLPHPTVYKFYSLMSSSNHCKLLKLSKYIKEAMDVRKHILETMLN